MRFHIFVYTLLYIYVSTELNKRRTNETVRKKILYQTTNKFTEYLTHVLLFVFPYVYLYTKLFLEVVFWFILGIFNKKNAFFIPP